MMHFRMYGSCWYAGKGNLGPVAVNILKSVYQLL